LKGQYIKNIDKTFNKEELIEYTVKVDIYYQRYREKIEIDIIEEQKWKVILGNTIASMSQS